MSLVYFGQFWRKKRFWSYKLNINDETHTPWLFDNHAPYSLSESSSATVTICSIATADSFHVPAIHRKQLTPNVNHGPLQPTLSKDWLHGVACLVQSPQPRSAATNSAALWVPTASSSYGSAKELAGLHRTASAISLFTYFLRSDKFPCFGQTS